MTDKEQICGKPCPLHGHKCGVVEMDPAQTRSMRKVFGDQLNRGPHAHLCIFDGGKIDINKGQGAHSWRDTETANDIDIRLQRLHTAITIRQKRYRHD